MEEDFITPQDVPVPTMSPAEARSGAEGVQRPEMQAPGNANAMNPMDTPDEEVSVEEQKQYDDLFNRVMGFVYDDRAVNGTKAPADAVLDAINVGGADLVTTLGDTAGNIIIQFHNAAKRQGVEYSGDVLREVGADLVIELMTLSEAAGVLTGEGFEYDDDAPFTEQESEFHMTAVLTATQKFGNYLKSSGQLTPEKQGDAKQELFAQIEREAASGELDDMQLDEEQEQMMTQLSQQGAAQTAQQQPGVM